MLCELGNYDEALRFREYYADPYYNLGKLYAEKGSYERAISYYQKALLLEPDDAETHYNLGKAYYDIGLYNKAELEFEEALRLNPNLSEPHLNLGVIYLNHLKDEQKALLHLQNSLILSPDQPQAAEIKRVIAALSH